MMRINILTVGIFVISTITLSGQSKKNILDTVLLTDICIENVCFGDSIDEIIKTFGEPDTIIYRPMGEGEFEEPSHNIYYLKNIRFYEIIYPGLSEGLLYGCRINCEKTSIIIRGIKMTIGETEEEIMYDYFSNSAQHIEVINDREKMYALYPILLPNLKSVETAFIEEINLFFIDGILSQIWTPLNKN